MKSNVLAVVLLAVIVLAGLRLFFYYSNQPKPGEPVAIDLPVCCKDCGQAYVWPLGEQPAKCHFCGKKALWRALQCVNKKCRAFFPLERSDASGATSPIKCPKCGSGGTEEISPNDIKKP
ncbi:MAG: hypothetical protein CHACPFDD_00196 [Phycisphaerae bacterium]|nr:hypothetical protein [Phycisphaerae bacterium]